MRRFDVICLLLLGVLGYAILDENRKIRHVGTKHEATLEEARALGIVSEISENGGFRKRRADEGSMRQQAESLAADWIAHLAEEAGYERYDETNKVERIRRSLGLKRRFAQIDPESWLYVLNTLKNEKSLDNETINEAISGGISDLSVLRPEKVLRMMWGILLVDIRGIREAIPSTSFLAVALGQLAR